jgi:precorrin-6A/cobalt-precorrin-6A reductase
MIWIIGGTKNAIDICRLLASSRWPIVVSVTTGYGKQLAELNGVEIIQGKLNEAEMAGWVASKNIKLIVDASHPFAAEVSENSMTVAKRADVPYIRFERLNPVFDAKYVADYAEAIDYLRGTTGNILLTTGSKNIAKFVPLGVDRLYARVLSSSESIGQCETSGFVPSRIIGLSGVSSVGLNVALMKQFDIKYLVTKESGAEGGVSQKVEAAKIVAAHVVIIKRPMIVYPEIYSNYDTIIARIAEILI